MNSRRNKLYKNPINSHQLSGTGGCIMISREILMFEGAWPISLDTVSHCRYDNLVTEQSVAHSNCTNSLYWWRNELALSPFTSYSKCQIIFPDLFKCHWLSLQLHNLGLQTQHRCSYGLQCVKIYSLKCLFILQLHARTVT